MPKIKARRVLPHRAALRPLVGLCVSLGWLAAAVHASVINLTDVTIDGHAQSTTNLYGGSATFVGGFIGDALFRRRIASDPNNSGSGIFRDIYRVQYSPTLSNNAENGYNRPGVFDSDVPSGFDPYIRYSNLIEDASHQYFIFALDTHESQGGTEEYISLDDVRIYVGNATDPNPLPTTEPTLTNLGSMVYQMNPGGTQSFVLIDASLESGSGVQDLFLFVKKSLFVGAAADDYIYLYSSLGQYNFMGGQTEGFGTSATPEQWSLPAAFGGQIPAPEPSPMLSALLAVGALLTVRHRLRRRA